MAKLKDMMESLTFRIMFVVILVMLVVNGFAIISNSRAQALLISENKKNISSIGELYMRELDSKIASIDAYLYQGINENDFFQQLINGKSGKSAISLTHGFYRTLNERIKSEVYNDADTYFFYDFKNEMGETTVKPNTFQRNSEIQEMVKKYIIEHGQTSGVRWNVITIEGKKWLARIVNRNTLCYGAMICMDIAEKEIESRIGYQTSNVWVDMEEKENQRKGIVSSVCDSDRTQIYLHIEIVKKEIIEKLPLLQKIDVGISVALLIFIPVLVLFLNANLLHPIRVLNGAMTKVEQGESEYQITGKAKSREFNHLFQAFNHMIQTQNQLKIQVYEEEIAKQKLEYQNLQLQIHPHFLLNNFNLMYGMANSGKIKPMHDMILYLSDYFRYIFREGKEMETLGKELELIQKYLKIAQLRYPDSFEAEYQVANGCETLRVPPLLIHNLVENSINHGLNYGKITKITISAQCEGEMAYIEVTDTGRGMPKEMAEDFSRGIFVSADQKVHVGLKNTWQRVQRFLGKESEMLITSDLGKGTKVKIIFLRNDKS